MVLKTKERREESRLKGTRFPLHFLQQAKTLADVAPRDTQAHE